MAGRDAPWEQDRRPPRPGPRGRAPAPARRPARGSAGATRERRSPHASARGPGPAARATPTRTTPERATPAHPAPPSPTRAYMVCGVFGIAGFVAGLLLDRFTPYPDLFASYAAAYVMPAQALVAVALVAIYTVATRRGGMFLWNGALWALAGLAAGWVVWSVGLVLANL